jgi:hypothetical protein
MSEVDVLLATLFPTVYFGIDGESYPAQELLTWSISHIWIAGGIQGYATWRNTASQATTIRC